MSIETLQAGIFLLCKGKIDSETPYQRLKCPAKRPETSNMAPSARNHPDSAPPLPASWPSLTISKRYDFSSLI